MIKNILLVGFGGGIGSIARYCCQKLVAVYNHSHFPWGTFAVNVVGCLLIGLFWGLSIKSFSDNETWKLLLMTGLCGGFTTFSAFTLEGIGLLRGNHTGLFFLYVGGSVIVGLLATFIGMEISR